MLRTKWDCSTLSYVRQHDGDLEDQVRNVCSDCVLIWIPGTKWDCGTLCPHTCGIMMVILRTRREKFHHRLHDILFWTKAKYHFRTKYYTRTKWYQQNVRIKLYFRNVSPTLAWIFISLRTEEVSWQYFLTSSSVMMNLRIKCGTWYLCLCVKSIFKERIRHCPHTCGSVMVEKVQTAVSLFA
jgi:hypothetical protein